MTPSSSTKVEALDTIERAHERLGLTYRELAQVLGADESSLHRWRRGESQPSPVFARQIRVLGRCLDQLSRAFDSWETARSWLTSCPERLDGERPVDLLRDGQADRVIAELHLMNATPPT